MRSLSRAVGCWLHRAALLCSSAVAQTPGKPAPDPAAILAAAKAASGGAAWDAHTSLHTLVALRAGGHTGEAERWSEISTGRSYLRFELGPMAGVMGFDGAVAWTQEPSGQHAGRSTSIRRRSSR